MVNNRPTDELPWALRTPADHWVRGGSRSRPISSKASLIWVIKSNLWKTSQRWILSSLIPYSTKTLRPKRIRPLIISLTCRSLRKDLKFHWSKWMSKTNRSCKMLKFKIKIVMREMKVKRASILMGIRITLSKEKSKIRLI